jgi:hypothetical protein
MRQAYGENMVLSYLDGDITLDTLYKWADEFGTKLHPVDLRQDAESMGVAARLQWHRTNKTPQREVFDELTADDARDTGAML